MADRILLLLALLLVGLLYRQLWWDSAPGQQAGIWVGGELTTIVPLDRPHTLRVQGHLGESVLEVGTRGIHFLSSPCQGKVCIRHGWLEQSGGLLACLPNRVSVQILGRERRFDAINF